MPGLEGLTIEMASGRELSLNRGPGGLRARLGGAGESEREWTIPGASRGETGVLGEGIRQALLRDPTYVPAAEAARSLLRMTRLTTCPDAETVAQRAAAHVIAAIADATSQRGVAHVALSGGTTPGRTYELLGARASELGGLEVWFADERCVGPEDEESNFKLASETLLGRPASPPSGCIGMTVPRTDSDMSSEYLSSHSIARRMFTLGSGSSSPSIMFHRFIRASSALACRCSSAWKYRYISASVGVAWREVVRERSEPWTLSETESAQALRRHLVESLYRRTRSALRMAETMQLSLLPDSIPTLEDWQLSAHYEPAAGGRVGGDWYDAFELRDGRLVVVLGDVAGHGITAAGTMAQLRNALRAQLFAGTEPAAALHELNEFCEHLMPRAFATVVIARIDLESGQVEAACAGHLIPYLTNSAAAFQAPIKLSPPIGLKHVTYAASTFTIEPGHRLVMYSDGLVERRGEAIDDGINRLKETLTRPGDAPAARIREVMEWGDAHDDVTIVTLRRP